MITNPYKVLGVPDGASLDECTKAYKKLAKSIIPTLILTIKRRGKNVANKFGI